MKTIRTLFALLLLSSMLLACGEADTSDNTATNSTAAEPTAVATEAAAAPTEAPTAAPILEGATAEPATPTEAPSAGGTLVVYSGRSESLVKPLLDMFTEDTGIVVEARYGDTAEMAAQILEEGDNSPADVFFGQDAGALGALSERFVVLDEALIGTVEERFRSPEGTWVGVSGRARVLVFNPEKVSPEELPASIKDLTKPEWQGRIGWAPTNASLQSFVTALRQTEGDDVARQWLTDMIANDTQVYEKNGAIVQAVAAGEVDAGLVNHYYLFAAKKDQGDITAQNYYFPNGDIGSLINVAGVGILGTAKNPDAAKIFVEYLLSEKAQEYFANETFEYPLIEGVATNPEIKPLSEITSPNIDLSNLKDLEGTLLLMQDVGALQ